MRPTLPLTPFGSSQNGAMNVHAQHHWQHRFAEDRQLLEQRRAQALGQARRRRPSGGSAGPRSRGSGASGRCYAGFREHSDLDLLIEACRGLLGWPERPGPLSADLKRAEDLPPELQARATARALNAVMTPSISGTARRSCAEEQRPGRWKGLRMEPRLPDRSELVEAAALRLHSFYTGVERAGW